jgi:hypothetical protein
MLGWPPQTDAAAKVRSGSCAQRAKPVAEGHGKVCTTCPEVAKVRTASIRAPQLLRLLPTDVTLSCGPPTDGAARIRPAASRR